MNDELRVSGCYSSFEIPVTHTDSGDTQLTSSAAQTRRQTSRIAGTGCETDLAESCERERAKLLRHVLHARPQSVPLSRRPPRESANSVSFPRTQYCVLCLRERHTEAARGAPTQRDGGYFRPFRFFGEALYFLSGVRTGRSRKSPSLKRLSTTPFESSEIRRAKGMWWIAVT